MGGGGARAAYQVGVLRGLARHLPDLSVPLITGVSAGAINAAHLAAHHGTFEQAMVELEALWSGLEARHVFRVDAPSLARIVFRWMWQLGSGGAAGSGARGLVDTEPLREFLTEALHAVDGEITGIEANLVRGRLRAVALSTSSYSSGHSVTWVQGEDIREWERPQRRARQTRLTVGHVMASAALPLFFPAVQVEDEWLGDGGVRLTAPLSPALHLGARRILAISTRYEAPGPPPVSLYPPPYPPPAQIAGMLFSSVFLDLLDQDAMRMQVVNRLLERLPEEERGEMRTVSLCVLRPSVDLGTLAGRFEPRLPAAFRFLTRGLGTRRAHNADALSMIMFQPDYIRALMDQGEADAESRKDELVDFLSPSGAAAL